LTAFQQRATAETLGALARAGKRPRVLKTCLVVDLKGRFVMMRESKTTIHPGNKCEVLSA
jgi:hypothetical protein